MNEFKINPYIWFCDRELNFKPKHFTTTNTPITNEAKKWIYEKLVGRFAIIIIELPSTYNPNLLDAYIKVPSFEDPNEAIFYELTWS
jgi:hypothetical protein